MAKRKRAVRTVTRSAGRSVNEDAVTIVNVPSPAAPARRARSRRVTRRAAPKHRRRSHASHSRGGGILGSLGGSFGSNPRQSRYIGTALGGLAVGYIEKTFTTIPTVPFVGRKGAIAIAAFFLGKGGGLVDDIGIAAAAISGYQLGSTGTVTGEVMGDGLAAQM